MTRTRRTPPVVLLVVLAVCIAMCAVGAVGLWHSLPPAPTTATDMRGQPVSLDPGEVPVPAASSDAVADTGARLVVPSVQLDVPLGQLNEVDGQITPPGFTSAYQVRNRGVSPEDSAQGTVVVVMHSLRNGAIGPGNYLIDVDQQRSKLAPGAVVVVAGVAYAVTGSELISKDSIAGQSSVWSNTPNRLVLITCLQRPDGSPSTENLVITATR